MLPLVTCIMPTANRREHVARAIQLFLAQDYPAERRELVCIEDGQEDCSDLASHARSSHSALILHRHLGYSRRTIGEKRNIAVTAASGDLIAHWDDDDWHSPKRLSTQVDAMLATNPPARLCGADRLVFLDGPCAYLYQAQVHPWLAGGTLVYEKKVWEEQGGFLPQSSGEDTLFVREADRRRVPMVKITDPSLYVAMIHGKNAETRQRDRQWGGFDGETVRGWMSQ